MANENLNPYEEISLYKEIPVRVERLEFNEIIVDSPQPGNARWAHIKELGVEELVDIQGFSYDAESDHPSGVVSHFFMEDQNKADALRAAKEFVAFGTIS